MLDFFQIKLYNCQQSCHFLIFQQKKTLGLFVSGDSVSHSTSQLNKLFDDKLYFEVKNSQKRCLESVVDAVKFQWTTHFNINLSIDTILSHQKSFFWIISWIFQKKQTEQSWTSRSNLFIVFGSKFWKNFQVLCDMKRLPQECHGK